MGTGYFSIPTVISPVPNVGAVMPGPGTLGRDTFTAPGWYNLDFSVIKDTRISETKMVQFRAEFFNIFNTATFGAPTTTVGSPGFGVTGYTATAEAPDSVWTALYLLIWIEVRCYRRTRT